MGAAWRCDAIVGGNTCNLFNTNESGMCSMHEKMPWVETMRTLRAEMVKLRRRQVRPGHHAPCKAMLDSEAVCTCGQ